MVQVVTQNDTKDVASAMVVILVKVEVEMVECLALAGSLVGCSVVLARERASERAGKSKLSSE